MKNNWPLVVMADIHGRVRELDRMVCKLAADGWLKDHRLALLGDYLDRGPYVRQTIDFCCELRAEGHVLLEGNHEYVRRMMLTTTGEVRRRWIQRWIQKYEDSTLASYGVNQCGDPPQLADSFAESLPLAHRELLLSLDRFYEDKRLILIHAGLSSKKGWPEQRADLISDVGWDDRGPEQLFSSEVAGQNNNGTGKILVTGHRVFIQPIISPNRLMLNCGVEFGGPLVAWVSDQNKFIYN